MNFPVAVSNICLEIKKNIVYCTLKMIELRQLTFLGTGTSHGVPMIGCECEVCCSKNQKNKRTRASVLLELNNGKNILIDTAT